MQKNFNQFQGDWKELILQQAARHPAMQPADVVKLCYQASFGAEHFIAQPKEVYNFFLQEYETVEESPQEMYEWISPDFCRVNLAAWKQAGLHADWLFQMFLESSQNHPKEKVLFSDLLDLAGILAESNQLPFTAQVWQEFRKNYKRQGICPLHHSEKYHCLEHPSYRLINIKYLRLFPILEKIVSGQIGKANRETAIIALDGRCASGKSTLADLLATVLDAGIVHMDDFFLPTVLRTKERLQQPGGNVHYERFQEEVIEPLNCQEAFTYQRFDCSQMAMGELRQVKASYWKIVEGAYSCHPGLGNYMDLRVFSDIEPEEQIRRILVRNGKEVAQNFQNRWIPMEEAYINTFGIMDQADIIL